MKKITILLLLLLIPFNTNWYLILDEYSNYNLDYKTKKISDSLNKLISTKWNWDYNKELEYENLLLEKIEKYKNKINKQYNIIELRDKKYALINSFHEELIKRRDEWETRLFIMKYYKEEFSKLENENKAILSKLESEINIWNKKLSTITTFENIIKSRIIKNEKIKELEDNLNQELSIIEYKSPNNIEYKLNVNNDFFNIIKEEHEIHLKEVEEREKASEEYNKKIEEIKAKNQNNWIAYYSNKWSAIWHWSFSAEEIAEAWLYNKELQISEWKNISKRINDYTFSDLFGLSSMDFTFENIYKNFFYDYKSALAIVYSWWSEYYNEQDILLFNETLSFIKDWWILKYKDSWIYENLIKAFELKKQYESWEIEKPNNYDEYFHIISNLWYYYENWEVLYNDNLNLFKKEIPYINYIEFKNEKERQYAFYQFFWDWNFSLYQWYLSWYRNYLKVFNFLKIRKEEILKWPIKWKNDLIFDELKQDYNNLIYIFCYWGIIDEKFKDSFVYEKLNMIKNSTDKVALRYRDDSLDDYIDYWYNFDWDNIEYNESNNLFKQKYPEFDYIK